MPETVAAPMQPPERKLGRFEASKIIVRESWAILKADKEMMWFPVLSAVGSALVLVAFGVARNLPGLAVLRPPR